MVPGNKPSEQDLVITRTFDAPRDLVFRAWTDPRYVAQWWGPHGFTVPVCELDVRPGGAIRIDMQGPDGVIYPGSGVFHEVVPPERLVFTTGAFADEAGKLQLEVLNTVTFAEHDGKTKLTLQASVIRSSPAVATALDGMAEGWNQSMDRLAEHLGQALGETMRTPDMKQVTSKDGTTIAFDQVGAGPAVILVAGALGIRSHPIMAGLAERLAAQFTVFNFDRRGRVDSGDTAPYAVEREIEDIAALIDAAGGSAFLYGLSSGAALALEAANALPDKITKLALYEPPYIIDDSHPAVPADYVQQLNKATAEGQPGDAVEIFMTQALRLPPEYLVPMRQDPMWAQMVSVEHTLVYDAAIMGDMQRGSPLPADRWSSATSPALVIAGEQSPAFLQNTARALTDILPNAQFRLLAGQGHDVNPQALAPVLMDFFNRREPKAERNLDGYGAPPIPWTKVRERLEQGITQAPGTGGPDRHTCWLATVRPDGRPHVMPLGILWVDGALYFNAGAATRKAMNLAHNPHCVITVATHDFDLVVEGKAVKVADPARAQRIAEAYRSDGWEASVIEGTASLTAAYSAPSAGPPPWDVYEVTPETVFALSTAEPYGPTRWRF